MIKNNVIFFSDALQTKLFTHLFIFFLNKRRIFCLCDLTVLEEYKYDFL